MGRVVIHSGRPPEASLSVLGVTYGVASATIELDVPDVEEEELEALIDAALERLDDNADAIGADVVYDLKIDVSYHRILRRGVKVVVVAYGTAAKLSPPGAAHR